MKCVINDHVVLSRAPDGPIAAHIGAFAESRTALGYARGSIQRAIRLAAGFSHWLKRQGVASRRVGLDHVSKYLREAGAAPPAPTSQVLEPESLLPST